MKPTCISCLLVILFSFSAAASEWVSLMPDQPEGTSPEIVLIDSTVAATTVEIRIPGFYRVSTPEGDLLMVPGWGNSQRIGFPDLPVGSFSLALPAAGLVSVDSRFQEVETFYRFQVRAATEPETDGPLVGPAPEEQPFVGLYPPMKSKPGTSGYIGEVPLSLIEVFPFRVDGETRNLEVASRMQVTVQHDMGKAYWPTVTLSNRQAKRLQNRLVNFSKVPHKEARGTDTEYLIITKPTLEATVLPLWEWRNKTGWITEIVTINTHTPADVKNIILSYPNLEYVLLVGDHIDVPMAYHEYIYGDHWYACTTGHPNPDIFADLSIGRLSGSNAARITPQINKILEYEQSPFLGPWLKKTVFVAHGEQYPGKYTECKEEIRTAMAGMSDWAVTKYYGGESGKTNAGVSQIINNGVHLVNYRGHGDDQEWWSWNLQSESYFNQDVEALTNGDMRPVVFNIACNCGNIATHCLSEAWMDTPGGAVASLGATEPSYTYPNHDFDEMIYDALFNQGITDIGGVLDYADDYIVGSHGSIGEDNVWMYLWLGDPAMNVWLDIPGTTLTAAHATQISAGSQDFEVTVTAGASPLAGANVCLFKDGEVFAEAVTGPTGVVSMNVSPASPAPLYVTVTHANYLPYEGSAMVAGGTFFPDVNKISARQGGTVNFTLDAGVANGNRNYLIMGSMSGTEPGIDLPGGQTTVPVNWDSFTNHVLGMLNTTRFTDFFGTLDANGSGAAQLNAPGISISKVGKTMHFAFLLEGVPWDFASNSVAIAITP